MCLDSILAHSIQWEPSDALLIPQRRYGRKEGRLRTWASFVTAILLLAQNDGQFNMKNINIKRMPTRNWDRLRQAETGWDSSISIAGIRKVSDLFAVRANRGRQAKVEGSPRRAHGVYSQFFSLKSRTRRHRARSFDWPPLSALRPTAA